MAAASSGAIRAGKAFVELGTDDTALQKGLSDAQTRLTGFFGAVESLAGALAFGVLSSKITDLVKMWADAGDELYKKAEARGGRLGDLVANPEDVGRAHDLAKAFESVEKATKSLKESIGGILAPAFEPVLRAIAAQIDATKAWVKENEQTVQMIGWTVSGLAALGAGILGVVGIIKIAGVAVSSIVDQFTSVISIATSLIGLLTNPFALAVVAITALIAWLGYVSGAFDSLGQTVKQSWGAINDALLAGDLELAWKIVVLTMKIEWANFVNWFHGTFPAMADALAGLSSVINRIQWGLAALGADIGESLGILPQGTLDELQREYNRQMRQPRPAQIDLEDELAEAMEEARRLRERRDAEIRDRTFASPIGGGSRGLFNATAAFGLLGPSRDPIVEAIQSQGAEMQRQAERQISLLTEIAENQAAFA